MEFMFVFLFMLFTLLSLFDSFVTFKAKADGFGWRFVAGFQHSHVVVAHDSRIDWLGPECVTTEQKQTIITRCLTKSKKSSPTLIRDVATPRH